MPNKQKNNHPNKQRLKAYAKYSGLGFQMLGIILLGTFAGRKIDQWIALQFPIFTLLGVVFSVIASMYFAVKDLLKK